MQLDLVSVVCEPCLSWRIEPVAGPVVDDQEDLASLVVLDEQLEEFVEGVAVEDVREPVGELRLLFQRDRAEDVGRLADAVSINARLDATARPGLVEGAVEPEAGLVFEDYDSSACSGFFLISGRRSRTQVA